MDRNIVTSGGYFEKFMQGPTQRTPEIEIGLAIKIKESYYADKRSSD